MEWSARSALKAFEKGDLQKWIESYLSVEAWKNEGLLRRVQLYSLDWHRPTMIGIKEFDSITGVGSEFLFPQPKDEWERRIQAILSCDFDPDSIPPLIGWKKPNGRFNLADGNHRLEAAKRRGIDSLWTIIHEVPLTKSDFDSRTINKDR